MKNTQMPMAAGAMNEATTRFCRSRAARRDRDTTSRVGAAGTSKRKAIVWLRAQGQVLVYRAVQGQQPSVEICHLASLPVIEELLEVLLVGRAGARRRRGGRLRVLEDVDEHTKRRLDLQARRGQRGGGGRDVLDAIGQLHHRVRVGGEVAQEH